MRFRVVGVYGHLACCMGTWHARCTARVCGLVFARACGGTHMCVGMHAARLARPCPCLGLRGEYRTLHGSCVHVVGVYGHLECTLHVWRVGRVGSPGRVYGHARCTARVCM